MYNSDKVLRDSYRRVQLRKVEFLDKHDKDDKTAKNLKELLRVPVAVVGVVAVSKATVLAQHMGIPMAGDARLWGDWFAASVGLANIGSEFMRYLKYGFNDWIGRGLTTVASVGMALKFKPEIGEFFYNHITGARVYWGLNPGAATLSAEALALGLVAGVLSRNALENWVAKGLAIWDAHFKKGDMLKLPENTYISENWVSKRIWFRNNRWPQE